MKQAPTIRTEFVLSYWNHNPIIRRHFFCAMTQHYVNNFFSEFTYAMLLITRVHWPSSISLMTDPSGCWMLGKNLRWSIGLQLCANAVSTETRTLVSVFLVCHFMCLLWTHRDTKIQSWMFGPRVQCSHCWPANPLNFSTAGLLLRTPVHFAEGTLRNFCISYVYVYMFMRKCHDLSGYLTFPVTAMMIFGKRIFFIVSWSNLCEVRSNDFLQANCIFCLHFCIGGEVHRVKGGRS